MGARILVVEDDSQNLYLVTYLLENAGYEVVAARDGEEAVSMAQNAGPDLILMDMLLPRLDGYEATRQIRQLPAGAEVPIVALTAYSMKGDRAKVIETGCDGYIPKPIEPSSFVREVEAYLPGDQDAEGA